jgi:hypothetical protein
MGIYAPDDDWGVTYRSWEAFCSENARDLGRYLPWDDDHDDRRLWAFFGNSFVQAPGMLADHARARVRERLIFNLGRNEPLPLRMAQVQLLLDHGMKPERIFFNLMPVDLIQLGKQPLTTFRVTANGALAFEPRLPGGFLGMLVRHSQLAWSFWFRTGQHEGNPRFRLASLTDKVDEPLRSDLRHLFDGLARVTRNHAVPVTVLLLPNFEQVMGKAGFAFQDTLAPMLRRQGFDVFDARAAFCRPMQPESLFLPDKHFTAAGNQILLGKLLDHLQRPDMLAQAGVATRNP